MVQDTLVGLLGAALIVGSMVAAIDYQETDDGEVTDPPAQIGESVWRASGCEAGSLFWTPSTDDLDDVVGPRLTPAEGPVSGNGLFWLFVFSCDSASVNGLSVSPPSGAAALVSVQEPDKTANVSAPDGWAAVPAWYGPGDSDVSEVFQEHGFEHVPARATVGTSSTPLNDQVRVAIDAPEGVFEADLTVTGPTTTREVQGAMVGTDGDTFSVFHGPEQMDRRGNGTATVQTQGTTWVERLGLQPTPYAIAYDQGMSWNFTFQHEAWDANGTQGNQTQATAGSSLDEAPLPAEPSSLGSRWADVGR